MVFLSHALISSLVLILAGAHASASFDSKFLVNGRAGNVMQAGQSTRWQFSFIDPLTGHPPHHFHEMHDKPMHLVVVREDLKHFAHLHPTLKAHSHVPFEMKVNEVSTDPDNFAAPTAVPTAGRYYLYGEIMPMEYGMMIFPFDLEARGANPAPKQPLVPDPVGQDGVIKKYFSLDSEEVSPLLARYVVKIIPEVMEHCGTALPKLNLELFYRENAESEFSPILDLEPWLSSYGHAFVINQSGTKAVDKAVAHLHAVWPLLTGQANEERGPWLELAAHSHGSTYPADIYRAWVQIKHRGRVLSLPLTIDWKPGAAVISYCSR